MAFKVGDRVRDLLDNRGEGTVVSLREHRNVVHFDDYTSYANAQDGHFRLDAEIAPVQKLKVGDRVRDVTGDMGAGVVVGHSDMYIKVRFDSYPEYIDSGDEKDDYHARKPSELEAVAPALHYHVFKGPTFKVGDRVVDATGDMGQGSVVPLRQPQDGYVGVRFDKYDGYADSNDCHPRSIESLSSAKDAALRYNEGKGEHDYLLTYPGGVQVVFSEDFEYYHTVAELALWYRGESDMVATLEVFRNDAEAAGDDIASALAETNARGAAKYEVGNYLKGANFRQYCQSFVRHAVERQKGITHDSEGNNHLGAMTFNLLALDMCVTQGIGTDDRIRAPKD